MPTHIQLRRGSALDWYNANPILAEGEVCVELDTEKFKIGNGVLRISGDNSYDKGTTMGGGTLQVDSANALGTTGLLSFTGGTLQFTANNTSDYSARFSTSPAASFYSLDTNGLEVTLGSALTASAGSLTKKGSGILLLSATSPSTYGGLTSVEAGEIKASAENVFSGSSTVQVSDGATLKLNDFN